MYLDTKLPKWTKSNCRTQELIAGKLVDELEGLATKTATTPENEKAAQMDDSQTTDK